MFYLKKRARILLRHVKSQKQSPGGGPEKSVIWKRVLKTPFHKIYRKRPMMDPFLIRLNKPLSKKRPQMFSCEFCENFKMTFFYGIPHVAASKICFEKTRKGHLKLLLPHLSLKQCLNEINSFQFFSSCTFERYLIMHGPYHSFSLKDWCQK